MTKFATVTLKFPIPEGEVGCSDEEHWEGIWVDALKPDAPHWIKCSSLEELVEENIIYCMEDEHDGIAQRQTVKIEKVEITNE